MSSGRKIIYLDQIDHKEDNIVFCKECEEIGLKEFGLDPRSDEFVKAMEQHKICKEIGRFKGDVCSRVFIASPENPALTFFNEDEDLI